ncbi:MAG: TIGR02450 family Trp-rich protein [Roseateles sp.]
MNAVHPKKLLLSKWTAAQPQSREKHFLVTALLLPESPEDPLEWVELEAVHSRRSQRIRWRELRDSTRWRQGWV